jgi:hypothetical protein
MVVVFDSAQAFTGYVRDHRIATNAILSGSARIHRPWQWSGNR